MTTNPAPTCREAFEKYAKDSGLSIHRNDEFPGQGDFYIDGESAVAFKDFNAGWQACWNTCPPSPATHRQEMVEPVAWFLYAHIRDGGKWKCVITLDDFNGDTERLQKFLAVEPNQPLYTRSNGNGE